MADTDNNTPNYTSMTIKQLKALIEERKAAHELIFVIGTKKQNYIDALIRNDELRAKGGIFGGFHATLDKLVKSREEIAEKMESLNEKVQKMVEIKKKWLAKQEELEAKEPKTEDDYKELLEVKDKLAKIDVGFAMVQGLAGRVSTM